MFVLHLLYTVYGLQRMFRPWTDSEKCAINKYFALFLYACLILLCTVDLFVYVIKSNKKYHSAVRVHNNNII